MLSHVSGLLFILAAYNPINIVRMWLINCASLTLESFNNERELPEYAILSHRWIDGQEVLFKDLVKSRRPHLSGWKKIRLCCSQAMVDGIKYCWIDTCCIDKTSSAELSEAINSMYRYYSDAKVCYSYLIDVDLSNNIAIETQFVQSSWFTRCWTLQELLAPQAVEFYDKDWMNIGTRLTLCEEIAEASGIHLSVFTTRFEPEEWSIAQRMSWASKRAATRVEDVAYSLLGIFDVNIPLLYGEGGKAFLRLQEEIIRRTSDHTIFGWSTIDENSAALTYTNLLAISPYAFKNDSNLVAKSFDDARAYTITNLGLEISLPVIPWAPNVLLAGLNCTRNSQDRIYMFIWQKPDTAHVCVRAIYNGLVCIDQHRHFLSSAYLTLTIAIHLASSTRILFDMLRANQHPYFVWRPGNSNLHLRLHDSTDDVLSLEDSFHLTDYGPVYGFAGILVLRRRLRSSVHVELGFVKVGLDLQLNPFCIISDHTYMNMGLPAWSQDIGLIYTDDKDINTKTFWECAGLEESGWIMPDSQLSQAPASKTKHGVWAFKGHRDSDSRFTFAGGQAGEKMVLNFYRGWDQDNERAFFSVIFAW